MCTTSGMTMKDPKRKSKVNVNVVEPVVESDDYYELQKPSETDEKVADKELRESRLVEKVVFVLTSFGVILLSHALVWGHWALPYIYVISTPILVGIKTICYWYVCITRQKHYFWHTVHTEI